MNQRWVVAEIREIWCKNAVTSSEQHKVQGLSLDCRQARPQPPWSQSRPKWILRCYATLWDFFTELKLKFLETSLILRGTVKNVALEVGPSERKTVYCLCSSSVFVLDTGSTIASISGWFYGDFKMQWSCHWCLMVTKTSGNLAASQTRVSSESTVTATPAPADCSGRVRKYSICSFSGSWPSLALAPTMK